MPSSSIPRRKVVAGAAWAVPAVVVASAAPAFAASVACPGLGGSNNLSYPDHMSLVLFFDGADSSWVATVTKLSPMPGQSGFFVIPPPQNLFASGSVRFDFPRRYTGGANEDFTITFTLTKGNQVCTYDPVTINYFNPIT